MKIIVFLAHFSLQDGPCITPMLDAPSKFSANLFSVLASYDMNFFLLI